MTADASTLENCARWLGVVIAVLGAFMANPDATAHGLASFWGGVRTKGRQARGFLARYVPWLRQDATVLAVSGIAHAHMVSPVALARGLVGWGPNTTVEAKFEILDRRTRALDKDVGELQRALRETEKQLRRDLAQAVGDLQRDVREVWMALDALRKETVRTDARALPVIVGGLVLTGLAPDVAGWRWFGWLVLVLAGALAAWRCLRIFRDWRTAQSTADRGSGVGS